MNVLPIIKHGDLAWNYIFFSAGVFMGLYTHSTHVEAADQAIGQVARCEQGSYGIERQPSGVLSCAGIRLETLEDGAAGGRTTVTQIDWEATEDRVKAEAKSIRSFWNEEVVIGAYGFLPVSLYNGVKAKRREKIRPFMPQ